jgi:hypothetical protein
MAVYDVKHRHAEESRDALKKAVENCGILSVTGRGV